MFELPVDDLARAHAFYSEALGWHIAPLPGLPTISLELAAKGKTLQRAIMEAVPTAVGQDGFPVESGMITGILTQRVPEIHNPAIILEVQDIEEALRRVERHGGKIVAGQQAAGEFGFFAYVSDTEGNVLCLWRDVVPGVRIGVAAVV
ncbi:VOC family protein [Micromonospora echinaurantiaca]|uniref:VOC family protein n=1 Tax=Micromonospora echinaurantiaca TaxID=47857 RepID=UPI0038CBFB12